MDAAGSTDIGVYGTRGKRLSAAFLESIADQSVNQNISTSGFTATTGATTGTTADTIARGSSSSSAAMLLAPPTGVPTGSGFVSSLNPSGSNFGFHDEEEDDAFQISEYALDKDDDDWEGAAAANTVANRDRYGMNMEVDEEEKRDLQEVIHGQSWGDNGEYVEDDDFIDDDTAMGGHRKRKAKRSSKSKNVNDNNGVSATNSNSNTTTKVSNTSSSTTTTTTKAKTVSKGNTNKGNKAIKATKPSAKSAKDTVRARLMKAMGRR